MDKKKIVHWFVIGTFVSLYLIVSLISTIHVIDFFKLSNPDWLAISLAIAFEVGAAASLAAIIVLERTSKSLVWFLFILLTAMQAMGNTYYAYTNLQEFQGWIELFGLVEEEEIAQKRILSIISGAILPIVALGFIKSLVDYIRPHEDENGRVVIDDEPNSPVEIEVETNEGELKEDLEDTNDSLGELEKEVDRTLSYKSDEERKEIKDKLKSKMLELVGKEVKVHEVEKENEKESVENKEETAEVKKSTQKKTKLVIGGKPNNKKKPVSNKPSPPHYRGGST
jgi:ABC-type multidrug transport system fused ATPase/permease subunit